MTKPQIQVRQATESDGQGGICVIRRSILELCFEDHGNDELALQEWIANKTVESWKAWLHSCRSKLLVGEIDGVLAGVGMISREGELFLLYVDPKYRFSGISKSILLSLEDTAKNWGCTSIFFESTRTAYRFYREYGYEPDQNRGQLYLLKALR
ncbi:MAG: GNAT family N-acetyltransferase [Roseomonas sp.]|nr:GNAT family N-acetyltransferase [Roseomonas sp.]MCA3289259.1 GNAT family N-acetyltransferase [Roseomonas sp.]MCA3294643.1 GNAT family N-acetyltransferase [Roseomonas sp.]